MILVTSIIQQSAGMSSNIYDFVGIILVFMGVLGAFILAASHLQNQGAVYNVLKEYENLRKELDASVEQNEKTIKKINLGFDIMTLRSTNDQNIRKLYDYRIGLTQDPEIAGSLSADRIEKLDTQISERLLQDKARALEMKVLYGSSNDMKQPLMELQETHGDLETIKFLKRSLECVEDSIDRDNIVGALHVLGRRLIYNRNS